MKKLYILLLIAVVFVSFAAGIWYQQRRPVQLFDAPRQAMQRSTGQLIQAIDRLKKASSATEMAPSRLDQALVELHDLEKPEPSTAPYNFMVYDKYKSIWAERRGTAPAPVVLEIGPGTNLAQGVIFVMTGAKKYYGIDLFRDAQFYNRYSYQAVATLLSTVAPHLITTKADSIFTVDGDTIKFNTEKIEYLYPHQAHDIPLPPGSVDYVFSQSVLEHVTDPAATINSVFRILPSGGLTAHHFDLRDHRDFSKPLEFLKIDAKDWKGPESGYSTNRWRLPDFTAAFEKSGFRIQKVEVTSKLPVTEEMRRSLHPDFQKYSLEDLSAMSAIIIAEKP